MKILIIFVVFILTIGVVSAQEPLFKFGEEVGIEKIDFGKKAKGE